MRVQAIQSSFSLPTQRCFLCRRMSRVPDSLFSAYAEVFLGEGRGLRGFCAFLCLRRGVSSRIHMCKKRTYFSLPTQRCFSGRTASMYSFQAFLCLRRGVSQRGEDRFRSRPLFSAYAEVFPPPVGVVIGFPAFLCLRRGVSRRSSPPRPQSCFSLPTQRCFW